MAVTFFADLFDGVREGSAEITQNMANLVSTVTPAFQAVFIVYCMFVIYSYWENETSIHGTAIDLFKRIVAWAILLGFGMNIGTYMSIVMPFVTGLGDGLSQAYGGNDAASALDVMAEKLIHIVDTELNEVEGESESMVGEANGTADAADSANTGMWKTITGAVSDLTSGAMEAMFGGLFDKFMALIKALILIIFGFFYIAVAGAYLLVAQVLLNILAAIGPIFFGFALFPATRQFFNNWVGSVLNYGFFFLFATMLVEMSLKFVGKQLDGYQSGVEAYYSGLASMAVGAAADGYAASISSIAVLVCMFLVFTVVLFQLPQLASSLFGGLAAGGFGNALRSMGHARDLFKGIGFKGIGGSKPQSPSNSMAENKGK